MTMVARNCRQGRRHHFTLAIVAFCDDLKAVGDGGEAHGAGDFFAEFNDEVGGEGDDLAGFEVNEVVVGVGGVDEVVVGLFASAEVNLLEQAGIDEVLEGSVDGGFGDAVIVFAEVEEEFLGLEGAGEFFGGGEDGPAFSREFELALVEEVFEELFGRGGVHAGMMVGGVRGVNGIRGCG